MKLQVLAISAGLLSVAACEKVTTPDATPTFHLSATITASNTCAVTVFDRQYSSIGQIRGDVPASFIGTLSQQSYHGFGCWVSTADGDGDLVVLFSGNNHGKPLEEGTYPLVREVLDNTPRGKAAVTFRSSYMGDKVRTLDDAAGNVIVSRNAAGAIVIKVEAEVVRWGNIW